MQTELLDKHKEADLRVYAVWFSMYPTDLRERWPNDVLTDPRVLHYWDEEKNVGQFYLQRVDAMKDTMAPESTGVWGAALWDAYLVYGPESRWNDAPTGLRRWGRTVLGTQEQLRDAFTAVAEASEAPN